MGEICEICKNESRLIALEKDAERNSNQHKEFYEAIKQEAVSQALTDSNYAQILITLERLERKVDILEANPAENWKKLIAGIITALAGYFVAVIVKRG